MKTNKVTTNYTEVVSIAVKALIGAQNLGATLVLEQNTAPKIATDLYDLTGDPATPLVPGKQAKYKAQIVARADAYDAARTAVTNGREYCRLAIGVLKPVLGVRWTTQWQAAGFTQPSLALPRDPVPMLIAFREYFNAHAAHEVAPINVTAVRAQALMTAIQQAQAAVAAARDLCVALQAARDESFANLRGRMMGLRSELEQLLEDDDGRWYEFGFRRPADGTVPSLVTDLVLMPAGPGVVLVQWGLASLAENYRVTWRLSGSVAEPTEVGLFTDRQCSITGLASGANIVVGVSARNDSGETEPTEAAVVVG